MNLWIGEDTGPGGRELRLEGRLVGEVVAELARIARTPELPARIDLGQLQFADEAGLRALRRLASQGVELVEARPLMAYRLREGSEEPEGHGMKSRPDT